MQFMTIINLSRHPLPTILVVARSKQVHWFIAGLVLGLLLVLGLAVRRPGESVASTVEGNWNSAIEYGTWYLANNKRLFQPTGDIPSISNYTSGLNYGAIDSTQVYITAAALILSGETDFQQIGRLYVLSPWQSLILVPVAVLAIYAAFARFNQKQLLPAAFVILYALTTFPNYGMVDWALSGGVVPPMGWAVFFAAYLAVLALLFDSAYRWQWQLLLTGYILLIQPTYHTLALVMTICILAIGVIQIILHRKYVTGGLVQLGTLVFLSYLIYHAVTYFSDYARLGTTFLSDLYKIYSGHGNQSLKYSLTILDLSLWWHVANYVAVAFPLVWVFFIIVRQRFQNEVDRETIAYQSVWVLSLIPLALLFFAWKGLLGTYERLLQYGTLLALISAGFVLATRRWAVPLLTVTAAVCVFVTLVSLRTIGVSSRNYLTTDELAAITWTVQNEGCKKVLFTDFRISMTLGYWGCFNVIGPTASVLDRYNRIDDLAVLLYDGDATALASAVSRLSTKDKRNPDVILMSRRFFNPRIGFILPDIRLKPMTEEAWAAYQRMPGWNVVYTNSSTMVIARATASGGD